MEVERVGVIKEGGEEKDEDGDTKMGMKALLKQGTTMSRRSMARGGGGAEFDLEDFWDEGEPLWNRDALPIGMTLNLVSPAIYTHVFPAHLPNDHADIA